MREKTKNLRIQATFFALSCLHANCVTYMRPTDKIKDGCCKGDQDLSNHVKNGAENQF